MDNEGFPKGTGNEDRNPAASADLKPSLWTAALSFRYPVWDENMRFPDLVNVAQLVLCGSTLLATLPHSAVSASG